jgi:hypothetical protein
MGPRFNSTRVRDRAIDPASLFIDSALMQTLSKERVDSHIRDDVWELVKESVIEGNIDDIERMPTLQEAARRIETDNVDEIMKSDAKGMKAYANLSFDPAILAKSPDLLENAPDLPGGRISLPGGPAPSQRPSSPGLLRMPTRREGPRSPGASAQISAGLSINGGGGGGLPSRRGGTDTGRISPILGMK